MGFADDYLKVSKYNPKGVPGKIKLICQVIVAVIAGIWLQKIAPVEYNSSIALPFFKNLLLDLGWFYIPFITIVLVGASNSVNLTDGLDGLAIVPIIIAAACFALIAYLTGSSKFADYLHIQFVEHSAEL